MHRMGRKILFAFLGEKEYGLRFSIFFVATYYYNYLPLPLLYYRKPRKTKYEEGQEHFCDKCDYKSDKIKNLQAHMVRVHSDQMYHCDQCEYVGSFKLNLKHHQERMHSGKIIMCDKCNYTTRDANRLFVQRIGEKC